MNFIKHLSSPAVVTARVGRTGTWLACSVALLVAGLAQGSEERDAAKGAGAKPAAASSGSAVVPPSALTATALPPVAGQLTPAATRAASTTPSSQQSVASPASAARAARGTGDRSANKEAKQETEIGRLISVVDGAQRSGDLQTAHDALDQLSKIAPANSLFLLRRYAWLHQMQGRDDQARELLEQVIARVPSDLGASLNLALLDARQGLRTQALSRLRALKFSHPDDASVNRLIGQIEGR